MPQACCNLLQTIYLGRQKSDVDLLVICNLNTVNNFIHAWHVVQYYLNHITVSIFTPEAKAG